MAKRRTKSNLTIDTGTGAPLASTFSTEFVLCKVSVRGGFNLNRVRTTQPKPIAFLEPPNEGIKKNERNALGANQSSYSSYF